MHWPWSLTECGDCLAGPEDPCEVVELSEVTRPMAHVFMTYKAGNASNVTRQCMSLRLLKPLQLTQWKPFWLPCQRSRDEDNFFNAINFACIWLDKIRELAKLQPKREQQLWWLCGPSPKTAGGRCLKEDFIVTLRSFEKTRVEKIVAN